MKKRGEPIEVYFLTDPLCPWSWAMAPVVASLRKRPDVAFRSVIAPWLPSLAVKPATAAKAEWTDATKTGAKIDPSYWDRVAPKTSLIAGAAVKAADLQGEGKGEACLAVLRRAVFESGADPTNPHLLLPLAKEAGLKEETFRIDLGVGRFMVEDLLEAIDPKMPLSESLWWFGRRRMLRSWEALAEDVRNAERTGLASPALHVLHGKKEAIVRGYASEAQVSKAIKSVE